MIPNIWILFLQIEIYIINQSDLHRWALAHIHREIVSFDFDARVFWLGIMYFRWKCKQRCERKVKVSPTELFVELTDSLRFSQSSLSWERTQPLPLFCFLEKRRKEPVCNLENVGCSIGIWPPLPLSSLPSNPDRDPGILGIAYLRPLPLRAFSNHMS